MLDIYSDYLISSFSYTTATGLSKALSGMISHDKITRFLAADDYDSKQLWKLIKPTVRKIETDDSLKESALPLHEAKKMGVTRVAITNTDSNPDSVDYIVPANDRSKKSVDLILDALKRELVPTVNQ